MDADSRYDNSRALLERAKRIIPGGTHLSGRPLTSPLRSPRYLETASGSRVEDADGHEYVDFLMAFGPFLLGYGHREVEEAATKQLVRGRLVSLNHRLHIELVEALLERFPGNEMGVCFRSGSEATTAALRIARRATGRRRVARCGYHGWHDWCLPRENYVPAGLDEQVIEFDANDPATLDAAFERFPGEIAAVILAPEMVVPHDPGKLFRIARTVRAAGAVFIMDEVKTGFRVPPGSISQRIGLRPDMITLSKALGNGWPIAAVLGTREVMSAGDGMHYSGTFHGDTASMAAALAVIGIADREKAGEHAWTLGEKLIDGLNAIARSQGVPAVAYGEPLPSMPFFRFNVPDGTAKRRVEDVFYEALLERGFLFHPRHMWFPSLAHSQAEIDGVLDGADEAMRRAQRALEV